MIDSETGTLSAKFILMNLIDTFFYVKMDYCY